MSIFSRISKSRQQAREHNAKLAEQQKKEDQKTPYRHVPTHAASDAIASAPPSWREEDRSRIREANRRRSAMAASGLHHHYPNQYHNHHMMNMPGVPRVGSSLSHVSFPTDVNANPMVRLPRSYSYNGIVPLPVMYSPYPPLSPHASQSSREVIYSVPDPGAMLYAAAPSKGKEAHRPSLDMPRASPTYLKQLAIGESGSSSGSNSSQDDLEIRPAHSGQNGHGRTSKRPSTATAEATHRMRPGRRTSDSSIDRIAMANNARALRDSRPPTSMKPIGPSPHRASLPAAYAASAVMSHPDQIGLEYSSPATTTSSSSPTQEEEQANGENEEEDNFEDAPEFNQEKERVQAEPEPLIVAPVITEQRKDRRRPQMAIVDKLEMASSPADSRDRSLSASASQNAAPASAPAFTPSPITREQYIVNVFPEAESIPEPETHQKNKHFSKSGSKFRKNRWSTSRNSYPLAV